jgi:hypothetical protein
MSMVPNFDQNLITPKGLDEPLKFSPRRRWAFIDQCLRNRSASRPCQHHPRRRGNGTGQLSERCHSDTWIAFRSSELRLADSTS